MSCNTRSDPKDANLCRTAVKPMCNGVSVFIITSKGSDKVMKHVTFFFGGWEPVLRIVVVGTVAFAALVVMLRATGQCPLAQMNAFDCIVTVATGASFGRLLTAHQVALIEAGTAFTLLVAPQFLITSLAETVEKYEQ
jgi:hypothetical protein